MDNYFDNSALLKHQFPEKNSNNSGLNYWLVALAGGIVVGIIGCVIFLPQINHYKQALEQEQNNVKNITAELETIQQTSTQVHPNNFNTY